MSSSSFYACYPSFLSRSTEKNIADLSILPTMLFLFSFFITFIRSSAIISIPFFTSIENLPEINVSNTYGGNIVLDLWNHFTLLHWVVFSLSPYKIIQDIKIPKPAYPSAPATMNNNQEQLLHVHILKYSNHYNVYNAILIQIILHIYLPLAGPWLSIIYK